MQCVQQLNGYLILSPCFFNSLRATKLTKKVASFDYAICTSHILCMCPRTWQAEYELTEDTVPQSIQKLLDAQEKIKKAFPMDCEQAGKRKANPSNFNKRNSMNQSPRRVAKMQSIASCARSMGVHT